jgi:aspartyl-tRNA(Asn)/glutamyl-tRNA(Gln) amidotransferase subunit A
MYLADVYTLPASLAGIPAVSVPSAPTKEGLPVGFQIITPPLDEARGFTLAAALA